MWDHSSLDYDMPYCSEIAKRFHTSRGVPYARTVLYMYFLYQVASYLQYLSTVSVGAMRAGRRRVAFFLFLFFFYIHGRTFNGVG